MEGKFQTKASNAFLKLGKNVINVSTNRRTGGRMDKPSFKVTVCSKNAWEKYAQERFKILNEMRKLKRGD